MGLECINGIACKKIETGLGRKVKGRGKRYGTIPLPWLKNLPGDSGRAKMITVLWFLDAVRGRRWFSIDGKMCREFGISPSQKIKILTSLEKSGHIKLQRSPGKATKIKLIKPEGWK